MPIVDVILIGNSQSNGLGPNSGSVPVGIPSLAVRYWLRVPNDSGTNDNAFRDLDVRLSDDTHGPELQLGLSLLAGGLNVAIVKCARGNTFLSSWVPGQFDGDAMLSEVTDAKAALVTAFPGYSTRWHWITVQGESEAKDATETAALAWGSNFDLIRAGLEAIVGPLNPLIQKTHSSLGSAPWIGTVQAQQASKAWRLYNADAYTQSGDLTHFPAATYNSFGADMAAILLAAVAPPLVGPSLPCMYVGA